jgi:oxygen-independent coproporphyrinogen-3 oxidase
VSASPGAAARPPVALYIHFPFCLSICPYCDFVVYGGSAARGPRARVAVTVEALLTEIRLRSAALRAPATSRPLASVYLGGGTPSLLSARDVGRLLEAVDRHFGIAPDAEVTLEANPGPDDRGDLAGFRAAGVNRLSIGAQSLDGGVLRRLGRRHTPADVSATVRAARAAGFENVSLDVLYDVPGQTIESWRRTLAAVLDEGPEHVSAYALALDDPDAEGLAGPDGDHLPLRPGARRWRQRAAGAQDEDIAADCYALADEMLARAGYEWYEISNWSLPGRHSRHNVAYWTGTAWEAVGPGAHAFDGHRTRRWNAARLEGYLAALDQGALPPGGADEVDTPTAEIEQAMLRLRTAAGLPGWLASAPALQSALAWGRANGLLETGEEGVRRLTLRGRLLSNELFVRVLEAPARAVAAR